MMSRIADPMRRAFRVAALFALALVALPTRNPAAAAENTDPFKTAYGMSFYFDGCGDPDLGDIFRKAVQEKVDHCPYTFSTKSDFRTWATQRAAQGKADLENYMAQHGGKLPDRLQGMQQSCSDRRASPQYQTIRDTLARYTKGEIGPDAVITEPCNAANGPVKP